MHESPVQSALWLDDTRRNKMILESAQMLSTTIRRFDPEYAKQLYRDFGVNHPCNLWLAEDRNNFRWLLDHSIALVQQHGKENHKCIPIIDKSVDWIDRAPENYPDKKLTPFANCAANKELGICFKHVNDVHSAYRQYMAERWRTDVIYLSWNNGEKPDWYKD
jgi:hypothetical protein